jgi:hypothetical protein
MKEERKKNVIMFRVEFFRDIKKGSQCQGFPPPNTLLTSQVSTKTHMQSIPIP